MKGHVRKRGSRWAVVVDLGRDPATGRRLRRWHSGYTSKHEAEEARVRILHRLGRGEYVEPSKLTVREFLIEQWLPAAEPSLRRSTFESYSRNVRLHIAPDPAGAEQGVGIGHVRLQALTPATLTAFYGDRLRRGRQNPKRRGEPLSPRSVRYMHAIVHRALRDALRWGLLVRNPADLAEPPSHHATKPAAPKTWTADELRAFLAHVSSEPLYPLWVLYATTGVRRGEALGLHWTDVDLDSAYASIRESSVSVAYRVEASEPKTAKGRRALALDAATVAALRAHRATQAEGRLALGAGYQDEALVFARADGTPLHPEAVSEAFARAVKAAGLRRIRLHDLRHTWATLALQAGVNPKVVSDRLGHATVSFTLDTYSHVMPGLQEEAAMTVAALVLG